MNLPNALTVLRLILALAFVWFIQVHAFWARLAGALFFILASVTDFLDGYYARKLNLQTAFGKIMDPVADKFLLLSAFYIFTRFTVIPFWMFAVIAFREVLVTVLRLIVMSKGHVLAAEKSGKIKTVFQITASVIILIFIVSFSWVPVPSWYQGSFFYWLYFIYYLMVLTVAVTVLSGVLFFWSNRDLFFGLKNEEV